MNNIKVLCLLSVLFFFFSSVIFSQHGDPQNRRVGTLNSNQIKTVFMNTGVIAQPGTEGPRFGWIHPDNGYVGDMSIVLVYNFQ